MNLKHQIVLVTGASRGLGRAVARAFLRAGASVIAMDDDAESLQETRAALLTHSERFSIAQIDTRDEAAVVDFIASLERLDVVVNNMNLVRRRPLLETSTQEMREMLEINVVAAFVVMREATRCMIAHGGGHIINVAGLAAMQGVENMAPFTASKHALLGLGRSLEKELHAHPIRITTFCPGPIATSSPDEEDPSASPALDPAALADTIVHLAGLPPEVEIKEVVVEPVV
jgi:NAD(P)-dependent dehydrogenase (short-subunit alcohol dehydrogenase family)